MRKANFVIHEIRPDRVIIRDVGPWHVHPSVTNDAENVVACMVRGFGGVQLGDRRLFYYDSDDSLDELLVRDGRFAGFSHGMPV